MPRPARPWFRFYVEALSDRKLRRLTPTQRWLWVAVLGAARQSCIPGYLLVSEREPMEPADLADIAAVTVKDVVGALPRFEAAGMLHRDAQLDCWVVTAWNDRQFESDDVTARTTKHRSKERSNDVPGTASESESETETDPPPLSSSIDEVPEAVWIEAAKKKASSPKADVGCFERWAPTVIANDKKRCGEDAAWIWSTYEITVSELAGIVAGGSRTILNNIRKREDPAA